MASTKFRLEPHGLQHPIGRDKMIPLKLDHSVFQRPARSAPGFELRGQLDEVVTIRIQSSHGRDVLALGTLLQPQPSRLRFGRDAFWLRRDRRAGAFSLELAAALAGRRAVPGGSGEEASHRWGQSWV